MVSTLEQMQVPNGTGPGVRRSKRPLLASRTPKFGIRSKSVIKSSSVISSQVGVMSDQFEDVIVHGHVPEFRFTKLG